MKEISILGSGWLGLPLALALKKEAYKLKIATASKERFEALQEKWTSVFQIKIDADFTTGNIQQFLEADILIINIPPDRSKPNQEQFASLIPFLEKSPIQQVLFVSSTSVYKKQNTWVKEDKELEDKTHLLYHSEQFFLKNKHFQTTVIRMAGLIGGTRQPGRFFAKSGRISNSKAPVNLIYQEDCIRVIQQLIQQNVWGEIFNACANEHPLKEDFYTKAAIEMGLEAPISDGLLEKNSYSIVDNQKIKTRLGLDFKKLTSSENT